MTKFCFLECFPPDSASHRQTIRDPASPTDRFAAMLKDFKTTTESRIKEVENSAKQREEKRQREMEKREAERAESQKKFQEDLLALIASKLQPQQETAGKK